MQGLAWYLFSTKTLPEPAMTQDRPAWVERMTMKVLVHMILNNFLAQHFVCSSSGKVCVWYILFNLGTLWFQAASTRGN